MSERQAMPELEHQGQAAMLPRAVCETEGCHRTWGHSKRTVAVAKGHARDKGHTVAIIKETITTWGPA